MAIPFPLKALLVFAHKGEAQSFISELAFVQTKNSKLDLYENSSYFLLVTGEGIYKTMSRLSLFLGLHQNQISQVVNIGVAGALSDKASPSQIYKVSVSLAESVDSSLEYKSFTASDAKSGLYCVSAGKRVLSNQYAEKLALHADLVDRELWSIAYVCDQQNLTFSSFKLVSDKAGNETNCFDIKEKASQYSDKMLEYFLKNFDKSKKTEVSSIESLSSMNTLLENNAFHFTKSQRHILEKISIGIKNSRNSENILSVLKPSNLEQISKQFPRPKDASKEFILQCLERLNPFQQKLNNKITDWFSKRPKSILQVITDPSLEQSEIRLQIKIESKEDIYEASEYLQSLPLNQWYDLLDGNIEDV